MRGGHTPSHGAGVLPSYLRCLVSPSPRASAGLLAWLVFFATSCVRSRAAASPPRMSIPTSTRRSFVAAFFVPFCFLDVSDLLEVNFNVCDNYPCATLRLFFCVIRVHRRKNSGPHVLVDIWTVPWGDEREGRTLFSCGCVYGVTRASPSSSAG